MKSNCMSTAQRTFFIVGMNKETVDFLWLYGIESVVINCNVLFSYFLNRINYKVKLWAKNNAPLVLCPIATLDQITDNSMYTYSYTSTRSHTWTHNNNKLNYNRGILQRILGSSFRRNQAMYEFTKYQTAHYIMLNKTIFLWIWKTE